MKCWSCGKQIPDSAKVCKHCEAPVQEPPDADAIAYVQGMLDSMDPKTRQDLFDLMNQCKTGEEFAARVLIGDCPKCGSQNTGDCEGDPDIEDNCVARCLDCGQMWCVLCGSPLDPKNLECPCWEELEMEDEEA